MSASAAFLTGLLFGGGLVGIVLSIVFALLLKLDHEEQEQIKEEQNGEETPRDAKS